MKEDMQFAEAYFKIYLLQEMLTCLIFYLIPPLLKYGIRFIIASRFTPGLKVRVLRCRGISILNIRVFPAGVML